MRIDKKMFGLGEILLEARAGWVVVGSRREPNTKFAINMKIMNPASPSFINPAHMELCITHFKYLCLWECVVLAWAEWRIT